MRGYRLFRRREVALPTILVVMSLAGVGYLHVAQPKSAPQQVIEKVWPVRTVPVERRDHQPTLTLFGELAAARDVTLRPKVVGEIVSLSPKFRVGGRFEADETILTIDPFAYQAAVDDVKAQIGEGEAMRAELMASLALEQAMLMFGREQLALAERDVQRFATLAENRVTTNKAKDESKIALSRQASIVEEKVYSLKMIEAQLDQQVASTERSSVALLRAEHNLANTEIKAPFQGVLTDIQVQLGSLLETGDAIVRLIDDRQMDIRFQLTNADFGRLWWQAGLIGRRVIGIWRFGKATVELPARITSVVPTIDPASGVMELHARIDDIPGDVPLLPGALVEVEIPDQVYVDVIELPDSALFSGNTVYTIENDRLEGVTVEHVTSLDGRVLVDGDLEEGERVVTTRLSEIAPGLLVKVSE